MYVSGGRTDEPMGMEDTNALVCYHDNSDAWTQCAPMRHNRYYHGMAAVDRVNDSLKYTKVVARCMRVLVVTELITDYVRSTRGGNIFSSVCHYVQGTDHSVRPLLR